jgi:hypothetical protein
MDENGSHTSGYGQLCGILIPGIVFGAIHLAACMGLRISDPHRKKTLVGSHYFFNYCPGSVIWNFLAWLES